MKNNEERRQFVEDINNWEMTESTIWTQTLRLKYEDVEWYQIRVLENTYHYDPETHTDEYKPEWTNHSRYYRFFDDGNRCYLEPYSKSNIIEEISVIDKKLKEKGEQK